MPNVQWVTTTKIEPESARYFRNALAPVGFDMDAPNAASLRVIEKLGMKYFGNINPSAPEEPYFALSREDFFAAMATG